MKRLCRLESVFGAAILCLGAGCGAEEDTAIEPTAEMKTAIGVSSDAVAANMVMSELTAVAASESQARADQCPVVTSGAGSVTLDYGSGCVPSSGLVPGEVAGSVTMSVSYLQRTISGSCDDLSYGGYTLDGSISGTYQWSASQGTDLIEQMQFTFSDGEQVISVTQDATVNIKTADIGLDGSLALSDGSDQFAVDAAQLRWDYPVLLTSCPLPKTGAIVVAWDQFSVTMTFDADSPSTGVAHLQSGSISGDVDVCAYWYGYLY